MKLPLMKLPLCGCGIGLLVLALSLRAAHAAPKVDLRPLTRNTGCDYPLEFPAFAADGSRAAYFPSSCSGSDGKLRVARISATGEAPDITTYDVRGYQPVMSADGSRIAFYSRFPRTPSDVDAAHLLVYDTILRRVTDSIASTGGSAGLYYPPALSARGDRVVFQSKKNLTGENRDGNYEIFLYDTDTDTLTQITRTVSQDIGNLDPALSGDGTKIAFSSASNLAGRANNHHELFLYDIETKTFTQITRTSATNGTNYYVTVSDDSALSHDGSRIVFSSNGNLTGENPDGSQEVFLYDTTLRTFIQLSRSQWKEPDPGWGGYAAISGSGNRVAYVSTHNVTGENADGGTDLFVYDVATRTTTQITHTAYTGTAMNITGFPAIDHGGTRIVYKSVYDRTGRTLTGWNLFLARLSPMKGDLNRDGRADLIDVRLLLQIVTGRASPTDDERYAGDVFPLGEPEPGDGALRGDDAVALLRHVLGL